MELHKIVTKLFDAREKYEAASSADISDLKAVCDHLLSPSQADGPCAVNLVNDIARHAFILTKAGRNPSTSDVTRLTTILQDPTHEEHHDLKNQLLALREKAEANPGRFVMLHPY